MNFIKNHFSYVIIIILVIIILIQNSCNNKQINEQVLPIVKIDTIWKTKVDTIIKIVSVYKTIKTKPGIKYLPSKNCDTLKIQYAGLVSNYVNKNIYKDTINVSVDSVSLGSVVVTDTIQFNRLKKRKYNFNITIPVVTNTIIQKEPSKRQIYIGGNLLGNTNNIQSVVSGLLYKTKKDNVYQVNLGITNTGTFVYGGGVYWKIKLK